MKTRIAAATYSIVLILLGYESWSVFGLGMDVDLYVHKDKFGKSLTLEVGDTQCTNVPRLWANLTNSVDTHGSCMQFYDKKGCKGRIAVIQPFHTVHQMDLSLIDFHNTIQSISPCGAKVPSGRYVIQSAVDASILTVSKHQNDFASVNTMPPQAFIPKAQQWEVSEKHPNEYDIMPRIHETNYPVTYDGPAMKKGSYIRKVWKVESVGRGRYIIKSEWTQKCLYKTRIRTVEEHDCRAWSPNQEWVLRPLIAPTAAPPTRDPQLADGVNFQVPSRVVDKYLGKQKRRREKERRRREKENSKRNAAYLEPYRIRNRKDRPDEDQAPQSSNKRYHNAPPDPEVIYSRPAPLLFGGRRHPQDPRGKVLSYVDGMYPVYEDMKVEDPVFPNFLLHAASRQDEEGSNNDGPRYQVTRRPFRPEPLGHPDYIPDKKKYDGRVKDPNFVAENEEESGEEDEEQDEPSTEDDVNEETQRDKDQRVNEDEEENQDANEEESQEQNDEESVEENEGEVDNEQRNNHGGESPQEDEGQQGQEKSKKDKNKVAPKVKQDADDDPVRDVAGFMKLLFTGISSKMQKGENDEMDMVNMFEKK